ncbi:high choriolytic enzyme 1-like protein [Lates japonicus]|uniref:High choriolytic enzyme 1-like protein n=1 Tax=Lates japonicus TaxID=270547 RepID=A0AAD3MLH6_LATJO|nr:high choriolytic enzyme 1-like protein [Lates japonicus]
MLKYWKHQPQTDRKMTSASLLLLLPCHPLRLISQEEGVEEDNRPHHHKDSYSNNATNEILLEGDPIAP